MKFLLFGALTALLATNILAEESQVKIEKPEEVKVTEDKV